MKSLRDQFADWVEQQDPERAYDFGDGHNCAFAQFLKAHGIAFRIVGGYTWEDPDGSDHTIPAVYELVREPNTFGALASRLADGRE